MPNKAGKINSIKIKQVHPSTEEVLSTFNSIVEIQKHFQVSRTTIKKAIDANKIMKGFKWSY